MDIQAQFRREFLVESQENLDRVDNELVSLERNPHDSATLASIFRTIHTIKGCCSLLELTRLEAITHAAETLLARLRDGELTVARDTVSALLATVDAVRSILASVESTSEEGNADHGPLLAELARLADPHAIQAAETAPASTTPSSFEALAESPTTDRRSNGSSDASLRVDVGLVDRLMNLVGELVLARNQILQFRAHHGDPVFLGTTQRLNVVTSELQEAVMTTRMQPIGNVWSKAPRLVRDAATQSGKMVRVDIEGRDTELDKAIVDAIKDPLTHIIRNAVDHGIEAPHVRRQVGKSPEGRIRLRAFHEGGQIHIEVADDGQGIDPRRVAAAAVRRGLISAEQAGRMDDTDLLRLVFAPGFSTAEQVSSLSGRGVGMDVVRTNIERVGGQVSIQSIVGSGTTVVITIPLTLAIIPALIVASAGERYAIPQLNLVELVRLDPGTTRIERIQSATFFRLRGQLLPLVSLSEIHEQAVESTADAMTILVLKANHTHFGLAVDGIDDTQEIVVKPLGRQLHRVRGFAGATIMGDGRVALIIDVPALAARANIGTARHDIAPAITVDERRDLAADRESLLVFRVGVADRMAVPVGSVARLEEFAASAVETSGGESVVQYRGHIMPLVNVARFFGRPLPETPPAILPVVVCARGDDRIGLVVDHIVDVHSGTFPVHVRAPRPGILGAAVIDGRVTDLIDVAVVADSVRAAMASQGGAV